MSKRKLRGRRRLHIATPSPAMAVAVLALFIAMGGTAIAAHHYLITSTKQISPKVIKALKGNVGPAGPKGETGAKGESGSKGETGGKGETGPPGPAKTLSFTALKLENGWTGEPFGSGPPSYAVDGFGVVHLRGGLAGGTNHNVAVLPAGARPTHIVYAISWGNEAEVPTYVRIDPEGIVTVWGTQYKEFSSLEDVTFFAG